MIPSKHVSPLQKPSHPPRGYKPGSVGAIVASFKSFVSGRDIRIKFRKNLAPAEAVFAQHPLGQTAIREATPFGVGGSSRESRRRRRNFYEHIVRDQADYERITGYILSNAANWDKDEENT